MAKRSRRRRRAVVFLDANIAGWIALYLLDIRHLAHWISFWSPGEFPKQKNSQKPVPHTKKQWQRLRRRFFDLTGEWNIFETSGVTPAHMDDRALLSYMVRLREERYTDRDLYIFYTRDKKFVKQAKIQHHPFIHLLRNNVIMYVPLNIPTDPQQLKNTARVVRHDLETRLDLECSCTPKP